MARELRRELALRTGRLMFITHPNSQNSLQEQLEGYVKGGGRLLQIRLKGTPKEELTRVVTRVVQVMDELGGSVIVNDNWEVARVTGAWGVQIGQKEGDPYNIALGVTVNTPEQLIALKDAPIDYVGLGPLRFTRTKENLASILGIEGIRNVLIKAREAGVTHPRYVVGGAENIDVRPLLTLGVHGVAVSGSIASASDPAFATQKFLESIEKILR